MIKNITEKAHRLEWEALIRFKHIEVDITSDKIIELAREFMPDALEKIKHSIELLKERPELLLDKLGIDFLIEHEGQRYAIDVTTAKRDSIISKIDKMSSRLDFFKSLDSIPVIIRSPNGQLPDNILSLIGKSKTKKGVVDCRLGSDLCLIDLEPGQAQGMN
jgi:hypothetical protein